MRRVLYLYHMANAVLSRNAKCRLSALATEYDEVLIENAKTADIPGIQACNRASLPENYGDAFYEKHLVFWPGLSFVARADSVVGYVLGRVEGRVEGETHQAAQGHITSLAVSERYRRRGLARKLMYAVHNELARRRVTSARLHVRCSNHQALKLYASLGYTIHSIVSHYYGDGEAAYLMAADLSVRTFDEHPPVVEPAVPATGSGTPCAPTPPGILA